MGEEGGHLPLKPWQEQYRETLGEFRMSARKETDNLLSNWMAAFPVRSREKVLGKVAGWPSQEVKAGTETMLTSCCFSEVGGGKTYVRL